MPLGSDSPGKGGCEDARACTRFDDLRSGSDPQCNQDIADILRIHDLGIAARFLEHVAQRGGHEIKRASQVAEYLATPGFSHQVIVIQDASMGLQLTPGAQQNRVSFVGWAHQLSQVAVLYVGF